MPASRRRRLRYHFERHRPLTWRGTRGGDLVFEAHVTDGRTYTVRLNDADVAEVLRAAEIEQEQRRCRAEAGSDDFRTRSELEAAGQGRIVG